MITYEMFKKKYEDDKFFKSFVDVDFKRFGWEAIFVDFLTIYVREKKKQNKIKKKENDDIKEDN